jgi:competence protein ComEC
MPASALVLPAVVGGVAAGILAADAVAVPAWPVLAAGAGVASSGLALGWRPALLIGIGLVGFSVGAWRGPAAEPLGSGEASVSVLVDGGDHELLGTVVDDPRPRGDRLQLVLDDVAAAGDGKVVRFGDRLMVWLPRGVDAGAGDRLLVRSRVELAEDFDGFAYREYLARQRIGAIARAESADVIGESSGAAALLAGLRGLLLGGLNDLVPEPEAALGAGILLGVRSAIPPEISDAFAAAGLTHVVAISGWNIAIVAALVTGAVRPLASRPGGRWTTTVVAAATVGGYVLLTGASPSVVRAALMAAAMLVGRLGGSRAHAASALALAALVMLLVAPPVLWDVGFQLSLLATAGLIWFGTPIEGRLRRWPAWIREPVALTLAAQLTTLPVILVNFERLSLVAPIANVLVVPFVPIAMLFSAFASVVGMLDGAMHVPILGDALAWLAGGAAWLVLRIIVWLGATVASVPYAAIDVSVPPAVAVAWLPMLALATWAIRDGGTAPPIEPSVAAADRQNSITRRLVRPLPIAGGLVAVLLAITVASRPDGLLHITVLDIGQGDSILVEAPDGTTMLVDGGPDPELALRRLGEHLPFFDRDLDVVVLTHAHQDHVAGLVDAVDRYRVESFLDAAIPFDNAAHHRLVADIAADPALAVTIARAGQSFTLGPATTVEIVYPTEADAVGPIPAEDINNGSIVMVVRHGAFTALLTGDAGAPVERLLIDRGLLPEVDFLKVGHHGSASATTPGFLDVIRPTAAAISSGDGNRYGHPAPETLATLAARPELELRRTDQDGSVEIVSDGMTYRVGTSAGWTGERPVHRRAPAGSIVPWPFPTETPPGGCWPTPDCRTGSSSIPRAWLASPWRPPAWWPRPRSRWTARSSRPPRSCTTSTRPRSVAPAASMAWWARGGSRPRGTPSSRCRSPPTRSTPFSTTIAIPSAGRRSSWPSLTGTSASSS